MKINKLIHQMIQAFSMTVDAKDIYTRGHSERVADYSLMIAKIANKDKIFQEEIYATALLHDIGKIGIPDAILNKPSKLTKEELEKIKEHPIIGANILETVSELPYLAIGAKFHHERYDGKGYPNGLAGESIPDIARIIAVADAYDAMTSNRAYRTNMLLENVLDQIKGGIGTQFDPKYAEIMIQIIKEDKEFNYRG